MSRGTAHNAYNRSRQRVREEVEFQEHGPSPPTEAELLEWKRKAEEETEQEAQRMLAFAERLKQHLIRQFAAGSMSDIKATVTKSTITLRVKLATAWQKHALKAPSLDPQQEKLVQGAENELSRILQAARARFEQRHPESKLAPDWKVLRGAGSFIRGRMSFEAKTCRVTYTRVDTEAEAISMATASGKHLVECRRLIEEMTVKIAL